MYWQQLKVLSYLFSTSLGEILYSTFTWFFFFLSCCFSVANHSISVCVCVCVCVQHMLAGCRDNQMAESECNRNKKSAPSPSGGQFFESQLSVPLHPQRPPVDQPERGSWSVPGLSTGLPVMLRDAGHISVLETGSLRLVGGGLKHLELSLDSLIIRYRIKTWSGWGSKWWTMSLSVYAFICFTSCLEKLLVFQPTLANDWCTHVSEHWPTSLFWVWRCNNTAAPHKYVKYIPNLNALDFSLCGSPQQRESSLAPFVCVWINGEVHICSEIKREKSTIN